MAGTGETPRRRPRDPGATRAAILDSARRAFAGHGYEKTSVRRIATDAGCDPMLVLRYFGSKEELFLTASAACTDTVDPVDPCTEDPGRAGEFLVRRALRFWSEPEHRLSVLSVLRSAATHPSAGERMLDMLATTFVRPVAEALGVSDVELRSALIAAQLLGLAMALHVTPMKPLSEADPEALVAAVGPVVQTYLTGPLPGGP